MRCAGDGTHEIPHAQRVARTFTIEKPSRSGCPRRRCKLVRMLAAGEKIYAHLPAGALSAADSVDAPTYLDYRMPSDRRDEVRRLGACWDAIRSRYYVPAGLGLVAFEGWRERPPKS